MQIILSKKLRLLLISILLLSNNLTPLYSNQEEKNFPKSDDYIFKSTEKIKSKYLVDSGDTLFIIFNGVNLFTNFYPVDPEGFIYIPEIEKFNVSGKTINSIESELNNLYKESLFEPNIKVTVSSHRPITFYLGGEVRRPGLYKIKYEQMLTVPNNKNIYDDILDKTTSSSQISFLPPRLFEAIKKGNGFTPNANLKNIEIIRKNSIEQGGGSIKANIDLMDVIKNGSQKNNIIIYDGDTIIVGRSERIIREQLLDVARSNFSPEYINVFVNGNVQNPGIIQVRQGSTLFEAVATAGGKLDNTGKIEFIRFIESGKNTKNIYSYNKTISGKKKNNPVLQEGDLIVVRKNIIGKAGDITKNIAAPILSGYGLYSIFSNE